MIEDTYLILPGCDDTNRGDQALIWVTVDLARKAGYEGEYLMLSNPKQCGQSFCEGIGCVDYILKHPSTKFQDSKNIHYTPLLKIKWALAAMWDLLSREPLIHPLLRKILLPLYGKETRQSVESFLNAKKCFVKGGGFLHAHGGFADTYKIYYFLYHIRLAQSFGTDVVVMPNSFGPFDSPFVKKMVKKTLSKCKVVMSRETISSRQLQSCCGITSIEYADLAFHLKEDTAFDAANCLREQGIPIGGKICVAITARPYRFPGEADGLLKYAQYKESLVEFALWLVEKGFFPVFLEHVFSDMDHENDMTCISQIQEMMGNSNNYRVFSSRNLTCRQMKKVYAAFDYTVGTRFHSVIFSLASLVPSIAITYGGNKGKGIMTDLGLERFGLPIGEITGQKLINAFETLCNQREEIVEFLRTSMKAIEMQQEDIVSIIRE